jgi:hypothetical protein
MIERDDSMPPTASFLSSEGRRQAGVPTIVVVVMITMLIIITVIIINRGNAGRLAFPR